MPLDSPNTDTIRPGLLLVGHGTRDEVGRREFLETAEILSKRLGKVPVEPCFLELASPDIATGVGRLVERGVSQMTVIPLMLLAGRHVRHDIPEETARASAQFPSLKVRQAPHLGCCDGLLRLSAQRYREATHGAFTTDPGRTLLLLVGRGGSSAEALDEMNRFADQHVANIDAQWIRTCFLARQRPSLGEALREVASESFDRVVVQPHLLFSGRLLARVREEVAELRRSERDNTEWLLAEHLGSCLELAEMIAESAFGGPRDSGSEISATDVQST
jgi:sirohydrochlorin ferrochelatase